LRGESGRMELKNISIMIEWWSGLDGPNGLTSAPVLRSYDSRLGTLSMQSLHVLPMSAWVSSHSPKDMVGCIGHAKFSLCCSRTGAGVWRLGAFHSNFITV